MAFGFIFMLIEAFGSVDIYLFLVRTILPFQYLDKSSLILLAIDEILAKLAIVSKIFLRIDIDAEQILICFNLKFNFRTKI